MMLINEIKTIKMLSFRDLLHYFQQYTCDYQGIIMTYMGPITMLHFKRLLTSLSSEFGMPLTDIETSDELILTQFTKRLTIDSRDSLL